MRDEDVIVKIVHPGTGGLSAMLPSPCLNGRTNTRITDLMGLANQTTKVRP